MIDTAFIQGLGLIVMAAALFALMARAIRMPTIAAYLFAGLALGPLAGLVHITHSLEIIAEAGIVLLLFLVGLELNFSKFQDVGRVAVVAGLAQVVLTMAGGFAVGWVLEFKPMEALFLAAALTFSSTVVVVKLLDEKRSLYSLHGRIAVGIFLVQDVVVILMLTVIGGMGNGSGMEATTVAWNAAKALGGLTVLLGLVVFASRNILAAPSRWVASVPDALLIWSLCWCFLLVLAAHLLELSPAIGAFLAGISLAQLPYNHDLQRRVRPLMNFFVAIFFVSLGVNMDVHAGMARIGTVLMLSVFVLAGKLVLFAAILRVLGQRRRTSVLTGITVAQVSEFSLILVAKGQAGGLIGNELLPIVTMVGLITICASAYMILYDEQLYAWLIRRGWLPASGANHSDDLRPMAVAGMKGHIIVVGMNTLGRDLARRLTEAGHPVLAVDTDPRKLEGLLCPVLVGNMATMEVMEDAGLSQARLLVTALHIEEVNDLLAYHCHRLNVPCAAHVVDLSTVDNLLEMNTAYLMIPKVDGVKLQNRTLKELKVLPP